MENIRINSLKSWTSVYCFLNHLLKVPAMVAHLGGENFWENIEEYEKHSPIYYFENVVTPTQVIHGANDLRVPFTQGQEFYNALKSKDVDTEMVSLSAYRSRTPGTKVFNGCHAANTQLVFHLQGK